mmetsp:Transcript_15691/g.37844  ORF Transcript_15691/g.37844 Transcript_15691/m.37844 type:complete len:211 (-) Transcript_15691:1749-2381(-)
MLHLSVGNELSKQINPPVQHSPLLIHLLGQLEIGVELLCFVLCRQLGHLHILFLWLQLGMVQMLPQAQQSGGVRRWRCAKSRVPDRLRHLHVGPIWVVGLIDDTLVVVAMGISSTHRYLWSVRVHALLGSSEEPLLIAGPLLLSAIGSEHSQRIKRYVDRLRRIHVPVLHNLRLIIGVLIQLKGHRLAHNGLVHQVFVTRPALFPRRNDG